VTPHWGAQVRTETVDDPEMLELMRRSNCFNVYVGFESINPRTLKLFQKKQDLDKIERANERFHAHNIKIHGMFVIGSDEDDQETLDATAAFAKSRQLESVQFMILTPCPGSPDWDHQYAKGSKDILTTDWSLYDGHHVVHQPRKLSPYELQVGSTRAMKKFYLGTIAGSLVVRRDIYTRESTVRKRLIASGQGQRRIRYELRQNLYGEVERGARRASSGRETVAVRIFLQQRWAAPAAVPGDLGVEVIRSRPRCRRRRSLSMPIAPTRCTTRERVNVIIAPIVKRDAGATNLSQRLNALTKALQATWTGSRRSSHCPSTRTEAPSSKRSRRSSSTPRT
jgi:hypothetical protein